jgi:hypothetical protein
MNNTFRALPRVAFRPLRTAQISTTSRAFSVSRICANASRSPPSPPDAEAAALNCGKSAPTYLGTTKRLPEFNLVDKVVLVSGAARGLGLVQAEALLEAGAIGMSAFFTAGVNAS